MGKKGLQVISVSRLDFILHNQDTFPVLYPATVERRMFYQHFITQNDTKVKQQPETMPTHIMFYAFFMQMSNLLKAVMHTFLYIKIYIFRNVIYAILQEFWRL